VAVDDVDPLVDEPPAEPLVNSSWRRLPVRTPVERGDDEVGVVSGDGIEYFVDERARFGDDRIERREGGPGAVSRGGERL